MSLRNILPTAVLSSIAFAAPARAQQPEAWARDILGSYTESNRERYLDNRMRAEIVTGQYRAALTTADSLKAARSLPGRALPADWILCV
jgi:hypothetical protein